MNSLLNPVAEFGNLVSAREHCRKVLVDLASNDSKIICLDSDMGGLDSLFGSVLGEQYLDVGIAEANMISIAAGLAKVGLLPVAHTMAGFAIGRACEQIRLDVALHNLPVVIVASHGGFSSGHYGPTHFCNEDIALLRCFPNMTIVVPCDAYEAELALCSALNNHGPVYIRLGRKPSPILHDTKTQFVLGKARTIRAGEDIGVIACGPNALASAIESADQLSSIASVRVINMPTIKPLDSETILKAARELPHLVTVEEHMVSGGLGGAVCELVAQHKLCHVTCIGVTDTVPSKVGDEFALLKKYGISSAGVSNTILRLLDINSGVSVT